MSSDLVFYLHRLGVKIYQVSANEVTTILDVVSTDPQEISTKMASFSGKSFRLLMADTISYLFQTDIPKSNLSITRDLVLSKIKNEIPENFTDLSWDYKIIGGDESNHKLLVFAPVLEFQNIITLVSQEQKITFEVIEPESIALTRHPNPIIGIIQKNDQNLRDEQTLNISIKPTPDSSNPHKTKVLITIFLVIAILAIGAFLTINLVSAPKKSLQVSLPTPTLSPTAIPTPTAIAVTWNELTLNIKNGTSKSGYAGQIATKFTAEGITSIQTGNADNKNYSSSKLTFKSDLLRQTHLSKIISIYPINEDNVNVDNTIVDDAILILGTN